jgi:flagellar protein FliL
MSDTEKQNNPDAAEKKGGKKFVIIIIMVVLLLGGGGGGFYFWKTSTAAAAEGEEPDKKKGSKKDAENEETASDEHDGEKSGSLKTSIPDDEDVKAVVELPAFIVNLADTEQARYLRMTVSLGVEGGEGESEKPDQLFITRVRNAMLAVLSDKTSEEILTVEGKAKLRKELLKAAQAASEEPHVQAIYITDFIVQL